MNYKIAAIYDTETTTLLDGANSKAFACLYIFNDVRDVDLRNYFFDCEGERVHFYRTYGEALTFIESLIDWGRICDTVPIIAAYNLMFDLQSLIGLLSLRYTIEANAQSSTNVYTLDLTDGEKTLLRFWDTFHLEMGGLRAMGETCGLPKALGDWDYSLIRGINTPLTDQELHYAKRDVQVIPAYLRYILDANPFIDEFDLGVRVITKTSLVRQMAAHTIANKAIIKKNGKKLTMGKAYELTCKQEAPIDYAQYALRKACFRGGLTFTSANYANEIHENVVSLDVTSMHHAFINGRYLPVHFQRANAEILQKITDKIINTPLDYVLKFYFNPFQYAIHAKITFKDLKLKEPFKSMGLAVIPSHRFSKSVHDAEMRGHEPNIKSEEAIRAAGYVDSANNPLFAFGKLMQADSATLHLNEIELYLISLVYEWSSYEVIEGETTFKFVVPPDYVTLQSNVLFETKSDAKKIDKLYIEGQPYPYDIPATIPEGIVAQLKDGTLSKAFFTSWYQSTIKGQFNGIYGTMAQDVYKPKYTCSDGSLIVDQETVINNDNWQDLQPDKNKVLYTYGMRIVGGSRLHLVIAIKLLVDKFGYKIKILGGDTDSLKISTYKSVKDNQLLTALKPLHKAINNAMSRTMLRVRREFPELASTLDGIGEFEIEGKDGHTRYLKHIEAWNKARLSLAEDGAHITIAGLSRPRDYYHIEDWLNSMLTRYSFEELAPLALGYNVTVDNSVSHSLQRTQPKPFDVFEETITDYLGNIEHITAPEAIALYPSDREIGDMLKRSNYENIEYLRSIGKAPLLSLRTIGCTYENDKITPYLRIWQDGFEETITND